MRSLNERPATLTIGVEGYTASHGIGDVAGGCLATFGNRLAGLKADQRELG
jgi:hypothetical protein